MDLSGCEDGLVEGGEDGVVVEWVGFWGGEEEGVRWWGGMLGVGLKFWVVVGRLM